MLMFNTCTSAANVSLCRQSSMSSEAHRSIANNFTSERNLAHYVTFREGQANIATVNKPNFSSRMMYRILCQQNFRPYFCPRWRFSSGAASARLGRDANATPDEKLTIQPALWSSTKELTKHDNHDSHEFHKRSGQKHRECLSESGVHGTKQILFWQPSPRDEESVIHPRDCRLSRNCEGPLWRTLFKPAIDCQWLSQASWVKRLSAATCDLVADRPRRKQFAGYFLAFLVAQSHSAEVKAREMDTLKGFFMTS